MHRTEGANNLDFMFQDGPPGTCVEEDWLNAVQEEIANVIEQAGLTLKTASTETRDQLFSALQRGISFPLATEMIFVQSSPPVGWTRNAARQDNAMLCYAAAGNIAAGGAANPQSTHTHTGPSHSHDAGTLTGPNHNHQWFNWIAIDTVGQSYDVNGAAEDVGSLAVTGKNIATGGGAPTEAISHDAYTTKVAGATTGSTGAEGTGATGSNSAPYYQEVISAIKD